MKVYILTGSCDHELTNVLGVFSTMEKAEAVREHEKTINPSWYDSYFIETWEIDGKQID